MQLEEFKNHQVFKKIEEVKLELSKLSNDKRFQNEIHAQKVQLSTHYLNYLETRLNLVDTVLLDNFLFDENVVLLEYIKTLCLIMCCFLQIDMIIAILKHESRIQFQN